MINKKITVILPCYNEGDNILPLYNRIIDSLKNITKKYEIIFVENGSRDNSWDVLNELLDKDPNVVVIKLSRGGFDSAWGPFAAAMERATGDCIINMDGDGEDPPELIPRFVEKWQEGFNIVYGIRKSRKVSFFRNFCYKAFYRTLRKISYVKMPIDAGEFALMDRKVVDAINSLPEKDRYLRGLRAWVGFKATGVPYARQARMHGKTTNSFIDNVRWAFKAIFSFSYFPLILISYLAFFTFLISIIGIIAYIFLYFTQANPPQGITTIIILILFLGSIQLFSISIIGGYIAKIYREVQGRPPYILDEVIRGKDRKKK